MSEDSGFEYLAQGTKLLCLEERSDAQLNLSSKTRGFTSILVAIDGSDVSLRAAEHAARIARQDGAKLVALHVVQVPPFDVKGELADSYDNARRSAQVWLGAAEDVAARQGIAMKTEILVGAHSVVDAILGYAETMAVDLIVSGTRGRTPSRRMLVGSVASGLVEFANCAVLVVR